MTTLFEATFRLAGEITPLWESDVDTANDDNSLTDSLATFSADHVGGTIWLLSGTLQGTSIIVTSKTSATVLAFAAQSATIDIGDHYALANLDFRRGVLRRAVNEALRRYGRRRTEDATLVSVSEQEEYTLPAGVSDIKEVWIAQATTSPYNYQQLFHWDEVDGELRFPVGHAPADDDYKLKLVYRAQHEDLDADTDELPTDVSHELIHWQAMTWLCSEGNRRFANDPKRDLINKMNESQQRLTGQIRNWREWQRSTRPADN